jgi:hypothetical protein
MCERFRPLCWPSLSIQVTRQSVLSRVAISDDRSLSMSPLLVLQRCGASSSVPRFLCLPTKPRLIASSILCRSRNTIGVASAVEIITAGVWMCMLIDVVVCGCLFLAACWLASLPRRTARVCCPSSGPRGTTAPPPTCSSSSRLSRAWPMTGGVVGPSSTLAACRVVLLAQCCSCCALCCVGGMV